jgi:hypothetical protein
LRQNVARAAARRFAQAIGPYYSGYLMPKKIAATANALIITVRQS